AQRPEAAMSVVSGVGALMPPPVAPVRDFRWLAQPSGMAVARHLGVVTVPAADALSAPGRPTTTAANAVTAPLGDPLTAATLGILLLRDPLTAPVLLGMTLVFAGLALLALAGRRRVAPEAVETAG